MNVTRMSRPLVGVLGLALLIGALAYAATRNKKDTAVAAGDPPGGLSDGRTAPGGGTAGVKPAGVNSAGGNTTNGVPGNGTTGNGASGNATPGNAKAGNVPPAGPPSLSASSPVPLAQPTFSSAAAQSALADGKAKLDAGDLLAGRKTLNDALNANAFSAADAAKAKAWIAEANKTLVFSPRHFSDDPYGGTFTVPAGGVLARIAKKYSVTADLLCRINGLSDPRKLRASQTIKVTQGPFHAVVNKTAFTLDLYLGGVPGEKSAMYVTTFPVGLGKDDSTPTGTWIVEPGRKLANPKYYSPRGEGTVPAGDPKNPLGKFWIGLAGTEGHAVGQTSYGIHGTIDPDSIGKQSSMGCIRMHNEDVALVYEMFVEGESSVVVRN